jgi:hypothetical protein
MPGRRLLSEGDSIDPRYVPNRYGPGGADVEGTQAQEQKYGRSLLLIPQPFMIISPLMINPGSQIWP